MKKRLKGTTLIYDVSDELFRRAEIYESDDPSDTIELRLIDETVEPKDADQPRVTQGFGPQELGESENPDEEAPVHADKTLDGLPCLGDEGEGARA